MSKKILKEILAIVLVCCVTNQAGPHRILASPCEECGNGNVQLDLHEQCDDGNKLDGDGCSHQCKLEKCGNGYYQPFA